MQLENLLAQALGGGPQGIVSNAGFQAPQAVTPAGVPPTVLAPALQPRGQAPDAAQNGPPIPRPSPIGSGSSASAMPVPGQRPQLSGMMGKAGDYMGDVGAGVSNAKGMSGLAAFLSGMGGAASAGREREAAQATLARELATAEEEKKYSRGRDAAADERAASEFTMTQREKDLANQKEQRYLDDPLADPETRTRIERAVQQDLDVRMKMLDPLLSNAEDRINALRENAEFRTKLEKSVQAGSPSAPAPAPPKDQGQAPGAAASATPEAVIPGQYINPETGEIVQYDPETNEYITVNGPKK